MKRTFAVYSIPLLILWNANTTDGIFSAISSLVKNTVKAVVNALSSDPVDQALSKDPRIAIQQIRERLKSRGLAECEIDLDKVLGTDTPEIFEKIYDEMKKRIPRRSEDIVQR